MKKAVGAILERHLISTRYSIAMQFACVIKDSDRVGFNFRPNKNHISFPIFEIDRDIQLQNNSSVYLGLRIHLFRSDWQSWLWIMFCLDSSSLMYISIHDPVYHRLKYSEQKRTAQCQHSSHLIWNCVFIPQLTRYWCLKVYCFKDISGGTR